MQEMTPCWPKKGQPAIIKPSQKTYIVKDFA